MPLCVRAFWVHGALQHCCCSATVPVCLSVSLSIWRSVCLVCLSVCLCLSVRLSVCTSDAPEYIRQLAWYDSVLREDDFVLGATIFQLDVGGQWGDWDLAANNGVPDLIAYMNSV